MRIISTNVYGDGSRGDVTIQSELPEFPLQIEELTSAFARDFVLREISKAGIKGLPGISRLADFPYPINSSGEVIENLTNEDGTPLPPQAPRSQPAAYRARYEVTARQ